MLFNAVLFCSTLLATVASATLERRAHQSHQWSHAHKHRSAGSVKTMQEGQVILVNRCPYDVWIWSAGVPQSNGGSRVRVPSKSRYYEPFRTCDGSGTDCGGVSVKVSTTDSLVGGKQTQFEYTISTYPGTKNQLVYYDISLVDCVNGNDARNCPGHDLGLEIQSNLGGFQSLSCAAGANCADVAYYEPNPSPQPVRSHSMQSMALYFRLCSSEPYFPRRSVTGRIPLEKGFEADTILPRAHGLLKAITS